MTEDKEFWWDDLPDDLANTVFKIELNVPKKGTVSKDLRPDLKIGDDIIDDLRMNASSRFFWSVIHADMRLHVSKLDRLGKSRRGIIRKRIAEELSKTEIKQTDKLLDSLVDADEEVQKLEEEIAEAWRQVNVLDGLLKSIDMRHESLRSIGGSKRGERNL